jgi:hypothetical protein
MKSRLFGSGHPSNSIQPGEPIMNPIKPAIALLWVSLACVAALTASVCAAATTDEVEPDHVRGQISVVEANAITVKTNDGKQIRVALPDNAAVFTLNKASFSNVDFGLYVGSVAVRLDMTSPIVRATPRETISWLYLGTELRIIDEKLRGIAVGFKKWDQPKGSSMTHGWVDDLENRVVSIKYGPTQDEESDVLVGPDVPVTRMLLGQRSDIKTGAFAFVGANKTPDGKFVAAFVFVGKDGLVPSL